MLGRVAAALLLGCGLPHAARSADKPSIVLIMSDDQEVALLERMPNVKSLIAGQGATFDRAYFNSPLCSPSRATILTGQYAHNTGVTDNKHRQFYNAGLADETIAVRLKAAGYRTALVGKYFNGYPYPKPPTYVPPGWDYWAARIHGDAAEFDYELNENGRVVSYGSAPADYATDVYRDKAVSFIKKAAADGVPFFLELPMHAPHQPATPAPRHAKLFPTLQAPRSPSFNEADVSDKPAYIRSLSPFTPANVDAMYRTRARSVQAVDEAAKAVVEALRSTGRLDDTYLVFMSDNGFLQGQHRVRGEKGSPYEEDIRMPLYVRGPAIQAGQVLRHMVGNADLAPTFAEWAGTAPPDGIDGRSFAPLLKSGAPGPDAWRKAYPIMLVGRSGTPTWRGVRTDRYTYAEYETGERELYDNAADPYQLRNLIKTAGPGLVDRLAKRTAALAACEAAECRSLEDRAP